MSQPTSGYENRNDDRRVLGIAKGRTLLVVDAENIAGRGRPSVVQARDNALELRVAVDLRNRDHVLVGINHAAALDVATAWPGSRLVVRSGPNGADLALLHTLDAADLRRRYDRVVIASGDGIFAPLVADVAKSTHVTVVARCGTCSARLRLAATDVIELPKPRWNEATN